MGLAGTRKRVKINNDPNNTQWTRSTSNYGHRMLVSQGWQPGGVLGSADNAEYVDKHLTEASRSHIKAMLREDNLGLGAKKGSGQEAGECVGLDAFQGLLGRLNGKSDEVLQREQKSRDDLKRARYMEQRGTVRFVHGGTLVGDMDELIELAKRSRIDMLARAASLRGESTEEKTKTRKKKQAKREKQDDGHKELLASLTVDDAESVSSPAGRAEKRKRKGKNREADVEFSETVENVVAATPRGSELSVQFLSAAGSESLDQSSGEDEMAKKAKRRAEKVERRERKQRKREEKAARKAKTSASATTVGSEGTGIEEEATREVVEETIVANATPMQTEIQVVVRQDSFGGRHTSVRSRYIAAKRRAVMDPQALKEILMVKA